VNNRPLLFRVSFVVGTCFLLLGIGGWIFLTIRSFSPFPRKTNRIEISGENFIAPPTPFSLYANRFEDVSHYVQFAQPKLSISGIKVSIIGSSRNLPQSNYKWRILLLPDFSTRQNDLAEIREFWIGLPTVTLTSTVTSTPFPTAELTSTATPTPSVTPSPVPKEVIEVEWPSKMELNASDWISILLNRTNIGSVNIPAKTSHTTIMNTPIPIGTPSGNMAFAFGPNYKGFGVMNLAAVAFDKEPVTVESQPLDQPRIIWQWNIVPKQPGSHIVNLILEAHWKINEEGETIAQRQIWQSQLDILVEKPFIDVGQLNIASLLSIFVGSALSFPWIYGKIEELREKRKKKRKSKSAI
jgi:hypothetical protein